MQRAALYRFGGSYARLLPGTRRAYSVTARLRSESEPTPSQPAQSSDEDLLGEPTWSVSSLLPPEDGSTSTANEVTPEILHHLLRLSALPPPKSSEHEREMLDLLSAQLHFVKQVQSVDTTNVRPLHSIRDESPEAIAENTITMDTLKDAFAKETVVGKNGRIVTKSDESDEPEPDEQWDPLSLAFKRAGRFFVVETSKKKAD